MVNKVIAVGGLLSYSTSAVIRYNHGNKNTLIEMCFTFSLSLISAPANSNSSTTPEYPCSIAS